MSNWKILVDRNWNFSLFWMDRNLQFVRPLKFWCLEYAISDGPSHDKSLSSTFCTKISYPPPRISFWAIIKILLKKSSSLCYQSGSKTKNNHESYEIQFGCEKRNFQSKTSNQGELKGFCCSKADVTKIFDYFSQT